MVFVIFTIACECKNMANSVFFPNVQNSSWIKSNIFSNKPTFGQSEDKCLAHAGAKLIQVGL